MDSKMVARSVNRYMQSSLFDIWWKEEGSDSPFLMQIKFITF